MTLTEAIEKGITKLRKSVWAEPGCYLEIHICEIEGKNLHGPWMKLYSPISQKAIDVSTPQVIPWSDGGETNWESFP